MNRFPISGEGAHKLDKRVLVRLDINRILGGTTFTTFSSTMWRCEPPVDKSPSSNPLPPAPQIGQQLPRNVKILGWVSFVNDVSSEMIYPLMPQFLISVLGGNRFYLGIIEGFAETVASLLKLWSGNWSDRAGKRKSFVLTGYALAAIARPMIGIVTAPWQLFVVRVGDRTGKGIRTSPRDALIADSTKPAMRGRAFGFHRAMDHFGAAIGPLLAVAFLKLRPGDYRTLFLITLVPGLFVLVLLSVGLKEPADFQAHAQRLRLTLRPFDRRFRVYLGALVVFTLGNSTDAFLLVRRVNWALRWQRCR